MTFNDVLNFINNIFYIRLNSVLDVMKAVAEVLVLTYIVFILLNLVKETRAWQLLKGILLIVVVTALSNFFGLKTLSFILNNTFSVMAIGVLIIFQPELRSGLERIGRSTLKDFFNSDSETTRATRMIDALVRACAELSKTYTGALIVMERETKIGEIINTGIPLNAEVTAELLINIFTPNTPLHDGAVIIRDHQIKAATCYLPLTENRDLSKELGTRHRAAIGVTEVSDALVIVVSEETGAVSFIMDGRIVRDLTTESLGRFLRENLPDTALPARKISLFRGKSKHGES